MLYSCFIHALPSHVPSKQARDLGLRLEKFAEVGLEEQAVAELERMMSNSHKEGFLSFVQREQQTTSQGLASGQGLDVGQEIAQGQGLAGGVVPQSVLFARGQEISAMSWQDMVTRQAVEQVGNDINIDIILFSILQSTFPILS